MRNLFLLLLLANLGLLGWQRWIAPDAEDTASVVSPHSELPRLVLADEARSDHSPGPLAAPLAGAPIFESTLSGDTDGRCVSIGPFRDLTETTQVVESLLAAGHIPKQRLAEGEVWVGHWVYLPAFESRSAARAALNSLKKRGVADSYIVPSGDERNAISLGVFAERERAERRVTEVTLQGYAPKVADRHRSGAVYWVDTGIKPNGSLSPDDFETIPGRIMRLEVETCPPGEDQIAGDTG